MLNSSCILFITLIIVWPEQNYILTVFFSSILSYLFNEYLLLVLPPIYI